MTTPINAQIAGVASGFSDILNWYCTRKEKVPSSFSLSPNKIFTAKERERARDFSCFFSPQDPHKKKNQKVHLPRIFSSRFTREREREMSTTATSTQAMLNQATTMLEDQNLPSQLGFYSIFPSSMSSLASCSPSLCFNQSLKSLLTLPSSLVSPDPPSSNSNNNNLTLITETLLSSTTPHKQRENLLTPSEQLLGGPQLLSLQRSTPNLW